MQTAYVTISNILITFVILRLQPLASVLSRKVRVKESAAGIKQAVARLAADAKRTVTRAASLPTPDPIPVLA